MATLLIIFKGYRSEFLVLNLEYSVQTNFVHNITKFLSKFKIKVSATKIVCLK